MSGNVNVSLPRFQSQWDENRPFFAQEFKDPSETVPDQSLTIPQIIAKYTRQGVVPSSILMADNGGNVAAEDGADPLDDFTEVERTVAAIRDEEKAAKAADSAAAIPDEEKAAKAADSASDAPAEAATE